MDQPLVEKFTKEEFKVISHTLGVDLRNKELPTKFYRNYFCLQSVKSLKCGKFREPYYTLFSNLEKNGYAESFEKFENMIFTISDKGIEKFKSEFNQIVNQ